MGEERSVELCPEMVGIMVLCPEMVVIMVLEMIEVRMTVWASVMVTTGVRIASPKLLISK